MGFYYGSNTPPPDDDKASVKDALLISLAVFRMLAIPLGVIVAGGAYIVLLFYLFSLSAFAGFAAIAVVVLVVAGIAAWEKTHPPVLKE